MPVRSSKKKKTASSSFPGFLTVPVTAMRPFTTPGFALYLVHGKQKEPVLYRSAGLPCTPEIINRLQEGGVTYVLIKSEDEKAYHRYVEERLGEIIRDPTLPLPERAGLLYDSAQNLLKELMEDPRAQDALERSGRMVGHVMFLLYSSSDAFEHLMQVTSFDYYTYTHSVNVMIFATALAQRVGMDEETLFRFGQGALLHDIGKSQLPKELVNWRGPLNDEQWAEMKKHPLYGWEILREQGVTDEIILDVTRHHHEKLNGRGYPDGLKGEEITLWSRICTIADIFDALTTRRSYKDAMDSFASLRFMHEHMREELDFDLFRTFVKVMGNAE